MHRSSESKAVLLAVALAAAPLMLAAETGSGAPVDLLLLGGASGDPAFASARLGATEAHEALGNPGQLRAAAPDAADGPEAQIEMLLELAADPPGAVMVANGAGDRLVPAAVAAGQAGSPVVTWGAPIPSGEGETLHVAPADPAEIGAALAAVAKRLAGEGELAVLLSAAEEPSQEAWIAAMEDALASSESPRPSVVETLRVAAEPGAAAEQAVALAETYPDLALIVAPDPRLMAEAAAALARAGLCERVGVTGIGSAESPQSPASACIPAFLHWNAVDLGYLAYHAAYGIATGAIDGEAGERFEAGRLGTYAIEEDPDRPGALRVVLGPVAAHGLPPDALKP